MTHALVIGGGIAGPVTAMALRRAGIEATVHEAHPTGADRLGAFLVLFANGLAALRTIGADGPVLACSFPADTVEFLGPTGARLGARPLTGAGGNGLSPRTLQRAALYRALRDEAVRRGVRVAYGKRLVDATTGPDGVVAYFADGTRTEGDVLIGADGIHSRTRTLLDPAAPPPRHTGQLTVCGRAHDAGHAVPDRTYRMVFGQRAFFGCTSAPDGSTYWFANIPAPEQPRPALAAISPAGWRERVLAAFAGDHTPVTGLVAATGDAVVGVNAYDIPTLPVWHSDRAVLVGDAVHATAPNAAQGASMAIEDSVVLARCLRDLPGPERAFAAYERLRRERVERVVALSATMAGRIAAPPPGERRTPASSDGADDWLTSYRLDWDEPVA
ncbi:FAD-dependent monooxygenase [Streptomyces klenkii]|uniref:FAD-dependent monooxygenase n=1 Tax=Streptomyces klenkii TaxID=1420899 RepID=A0A3B0AXI5_9ACTN|nr:FAD-dependent monooxygenase [Streptomyces klenkii]RKN65375.1 FAD-dependent monooxygenase [Streptomyces klenkii]